MLNPWRSAISPPATRFHSGWNVATRPIVKLRYVAGSTAATLTAWSSMLAWAQLNCSTLVTPRRCRIRRTIPGLSVCCRSTRMSAVWSGARNGPGRSTAWSPTVSVDDGSTLGTPVLGPDDGELLDRADVLEEPSPHALNRRAGASSAATTAAR